MKNVQEALNNLGRWVTESLLSSVYTKRNVDYAYRHRYEEGALILEARVDATTIQSVSTELSAFFSSEVFSIETLSEFNGDDFKRVRVTVKKTLEELDQLLRLHSSYYEGYRCGTSLMRLSQEREVFYKRDRICLAPLYALGEGRYWLRVAGCNAEEICSYQLSHLFREFILKDTVNESECYGHHVSALLEGLGVGSGFYISIMSLLKKAGQRPKASSFCHEVMDGCTELDLSRLSDYIFPMDEDARAIYRQVGNVGSQELSQLSSLEVPMPEFFEILLQDLKGRFMASFERFACHLSQIRSENEWVSLDPTFKEQMLEVMRKATELAIRGEFDFAREQLEASREAKKSYAEQVTLLREAYQSRRRNVSMLMFWKYKIDLAKPGPMNEEESACYEKTLQEEMSKGQQYYPVLRSYSNLETLRADMEHCEILERAQDTFISCIKALFKWKSAISQVKALQACCVSALGEERVELSTEATCGRAYSV